MTTNESRMLAGKLYNVYDAEMAKKGDRKQALLATINHAGPHEDVQPKFAELLGQTGARCYIEPPFFCDFGDHISLGDDVYINTNAVFLDSGQITIGDRVLIGPRVNLFAASHPIAADVRTKWLALGHPIVIGNNVWLGGGVTVNPGVTIGENTIIGSGAVVTHDVPANVVAAGNPCRVIRPITEADQTYWHQQEQDYLKEMGPLESHNGPSQG